MTRPLKISEELHRRLYQKSCDLSKIEGRRVSMGEIVRRSTNDPDWEKRLSVDSLLKARYKR